MSEQWISSSYSVPEEWRVGTIGELASINQSSLSENESPEREIEYFDISSASETTPNPIRMKFKDAPSRARRLAEQGDVIYSCVRPLLRRVFFANGDDNSVFSTGYAVLHPSNGRDARFIKHTLVSTLVEKEVHARLTGSGYPAISTTDLSAIPILIPPYREQQRIVEILSTWDETLERLARQIECKVQVFSTLRGALTEGRRRLVDLHKPLGATAQAQRLPVGSLGQFLKGKGIAKSDLASKGVPCLRYAEIYTLYNDIIHKLHSFVAHAVAENALHIKYGDIIFAASGESAAEIGKAVAYLGKEKAVVGGDTVVLRGHGQDPSFLAYALNAEGAVRQKARLGKGISIAHIHAPELSRVEIWLPPILEQRAIVEVLDDAEREIATLEAQRSALTRQRDALATALLTGRLRVPLAKAAAS